MLRWITDFTYKVESLAAKAGVVYRLACHYYQDVIRKEAVLANITRDDHILCVGGGMCPFSAILFHQLTGAKVTVIDNKTACIPKAKGVVDRLGLREYVRVLCRDGADTQLSLSEYSVVHLALQVSPMEHVFSQVEKGVLPGTKLLVRRPKKTLDSAYSRLRLPNALLARCPYTTHKKARNIGSTLLYVKQELPLEEKTDANGTAAFDAAGCVVSA